MSPGASYVDQHVAVDYSQPSSRAVSRAKRGGETREFESLSLSKGSDVFGDTSKMEEGSKVSGVFEEGSKPSVMFADMPEYTKSGKQWDELEEAPRSVQSNSFVGDFNKSSIDNMSHLDLNTVSIGGSKGVERLGLDGGGLPLRSGLGRVLCSLGPHQRFVMVSCGAAHTVALTSLGRLYTFGSNHFGQLVIK
jgi:hypothetical protein